MVRVTLLTDVSYIKHLLKLIRERACCPACGAKVPWGSRMSLSLVNNETTWCRHCRSWLTVDRSILVLGVVERILIFPVLALLKYSFLVAVLAAFLLVGISLLILYTAPSTRLSR